jgi:hypothetical protein
MTPIPLITSVPPNMSRIGADGSEIGAEYLALCIDSWRRSGFSPRSVNAETEVITCQSDFGGLPLVRVPRDAATFVGKHLVYFQDLVQSAAAAADDGPGPVVITNADIFLDPTFPLHDELLRLRPGHAVLARRVDVTTPSQRRGQVYRRGFDFFAIHRDDLRKVQSEGFIFGTPWWDYVLPTALLANGVRVDLLTTPFAFHLLHNDRWNEQQWTSVGLHFVNATLELLSQAQATSGRAIDLRDRLQKASKRKRALAVFAERVWPQLSGRALKAETKYMLKRVSRTINSYFNEQCAIDLRDLQLALANKE